MAGQPLGPGRPRWRRPAAAGGAGGETRSLTESVMRPGQWVFRFAWLISERLGRCPRAVGTDDAPAFSGFWFAHEIVGYISPDLEKEIVILSMYRTT